MTVVDILIIYIYISHEVGKHVAPQKKHLKKYYSEYGMKIAMAPYIPTLFQPLNRADEKRVPVIAGGNEGSCCELRGGRLTREFYQRADVERTGQWIQRQWMANGYKHACVYIYIYIHTYMCTYIE